MRENSSFFFLSCAFQTPKFQFNSVATRFYWCFYRPSFLTKMLSKKSFTGYVSFQPVRRWFVAQTLLSKNLSYHKKPWKMDQKRTFLCTISFEVTKALEKLHQSGGPFDKKAVINKYHHITSLRNAHSDLRYSLSILLACIILFV